MGYGKITTIVRYSDVSDYSDHLLDRAIEDEYLSTRCERFEVNCAAGVAKTIDFAPLFSTAVKAIVIYNHGTADYVAVSVTGTDGACNQRLPFGEMLILKDATLVGDLTLTANTSAAVVEVLIFGT